MLVLSRRIGETILIGDHIEITVTRIEHGNVRIAIVAPREIPILRAELCDDGPQPPKEQENPEPE